MQVAKLAASQSLPPKHVAVHVHTLHSSIQELLLWLPIACPQPAGQVQDRYNPMQLTLYRTSACCSLFAGVNSMLVAAAVNGMPVAAYKIGLFAHNRPVLE